VYDVNYPVIVTIRDNSAFQGRGYTFSYAMPVTLHNNEPYKDFYGYELFTTTYFDRGFCEDRGDTYADIRAIGSEQGYSNLELDDVNISLRCFKYNCPLGRTRPDQGAYRLRTSLPASCTNPYIIAEKSGYLKATKQLTDQEVFEIPLTKLKSMQYKVVYHRYNSVGNIIEQAQDLEEDMNVSIRLTLDDYNQYKLFPIDDYSNADISTINLVDGTAEYDLDIVLTQSGEYIGGFSGRWAPIAAEIAGRDKVVFHTLKYVPVPFSKEDKLKMMSYLLRGDYKNQLIPELS
jgi:hypothetical protein